VLSQVRISNDSAGIQASRIGPGSADLLIGADLVYSASDDVASRLSPLRSAAVVNADLTPTAAIVRNRDAVLPAEQIARRVRGRCAQDACHTVNANALTTALFGDSTAAHVLMLGFAWQKGLIPLSLEAVEIAIGSAVAPAVNRRAFAWGRIAAELPDAVCDVIESAAPTQPAPQSVDELVATYAKELTIYQNKAYATRYVQLVNRVRNAELVAVPGSQELGRAVALNAYRLMAYKDEYEVARLYSSEDFRASVRKQFDGVGKISVWLAPPGISRIDPNSGRPIKIKFGPWIFKAFSALAAFKGLRGGMFDPFGRNHERVAERALVEDYFEMVDGLVKHLKPRNHAIGVTLASAVSEVRGFGPVKLQALQKYRQDKDALLKAFRSPAHIVLAQAA
jgi:indolepyruvate ferredoxin oxidoreductase